MDPRTHAIACGIGSACHWQAGPAGHSDRGFPLDGTECHCAEGALPDRETKTEEERSGRSGEIVFGAAEMTVGHLANDVILGDHDGTVSFSSSSSSGQVAIIRSPLLLRFARCNVCGVLEVRVLRGAAAAADWEELW